MQEKIEDLIRKRVGMKYWLESGDMIFKPLAAEIATLFERKVIWEGEATLSHLEDIECQPWTEVAKTNHDLLNPGSYLAIDGHRGKDGKRVRVIVEEIDE